MKNEGGGTRLFYCFTIFIFSQFNLNVGIVIGGVIVRRDLPAPDGLWYERRFGGDASSPIDGGIENGIPAQFGGLIGLWSEYRAGNCGNWEWWFRGVDGEFVWWYEWNRMWWYKWRL